MTATFALAFLAGLMSTLSPCTLPILPLVLGSAISEHKYGPFALAAGLALSFTAIGLFIATVGFSIGLNGDIFRYIAASILLIIGVVMALPALQDRVSAAAGPFGNWAEQRFGGFSTTGLKGQFLVGLLLGAVWSPCVGPTLGAASLLAAQGRDLAQVTVTMLIFGLGAGLPLVILGFASREAMIRWRARMMATSSASKRILGGLLIFAGLLILSGFDKKLEAYLVEISPSWLTALTTQF